MKVRIVLTGLALAASTLALSPAVSAEPLPQDVIGIGNLAPIVDSGTGSSAKATATFVLAVKGQATRLQVLTIKSQVWKTIASGKQDSTGKTVFSISDPLEVLHEYRATTGTPPTISNTVKYQAGSTTKNTGLSTVYFNSNVGESVNTRKKYFDGEFSMTGSGVCGAVPVQKKAEMKGRGNYSWSFPKKSFTLKLDKKLNLCGMGESKKRALVANHYDKSLLRAAAAFNIGSKLTNLAWTPSARPIDVYVNGSYRGSYDLVERITAASGRINVPELNNESPNATGGYILEWDYRKGADHNVTVGGRGWVGIKEHLSDAQVVKGSWSSEVSYLRSWPNGRISWMNGQ